MKQPSQDQPPDPRLIAAGEESLQPTFMKNINLVFCCNVPIDFNSASQRKAIQHCYNNLPPNSYPFLGHSESLFGIDRDFQLVYFPGSGGYLKNSTPRREL
jgi:chemotaxis methyl-accepting protein methylase